MKTKQKILYIMLFAILTTVVILPCFAFANNIGDFDGNEGVNYDIYADNSSYYVIELYDLASFDLPLMNIDTHIPYSDSEDTPSFLNTKIEINTYFGQFTFYSSAHEPSTLYELYDIENDPDKQDMLAEFYLSCTANPSDTRFYSYTFKFENVSGLEEIDTDTLVRITLSTHNLLPNGDNEHVQEKEPYWQGYDDGYKLGWEDGKKYGQTLAGTVVSKPLDFMESLFDGIGNILNINLFPGISLGLLICIPLVFAIALFIIHMVRG